MEPEGSLPLGQKHIKLLYLEQVFSNQPHNLPTSNP